MTFASLIDEIIGSFGRAIYIVAFPTACLFSFICFWKSPYAYASSALACCWMSMTLMEAVLLTFLMLSTLLSVDRRIRLHPWLHGCG